MDIKSALTWGIGVLPGSTRRLDCELLLSHIIQKSREYLIVHPEQALNTEVQTAFGNLVQRRKRGEPVAYLTGHKEFFGLDFEVSPDCLIPRPETELLCEEVIGIVADNDLGSVSICDVGTGSGAIAVALAKHLPEAEITATDISEKALDIARKNAKNHDLHINFYQGDLLPEGDFDIVVANLPYLSQDDPQVDQATMAHEPHEALFAENNGLALYEKLFKTIESWEEQPTYVLGEFGFGQKEAIQKMIPEATIKNDLAGIPRIFIYSR
jgi:release factor glutamine methyltransferase